MDITEIESRIRRALALYQACGLRRWIGWNRPLIGRLYVAKGRYSRFRAKYHVFTVLGSDLKKLRPTICAHRPLLLDYTPYKKRKKRRKK